MDKSDTSNNEDSQDCTCSWSPVVGWSVCPGCCSNEVGCTHILDKLAEPTTFTCPRCTKTSYNPNDAKYGYCGNCNDYTGRPAHLPTADGG